MAKQGEIDYLKNLTPEQVAHAVNKPFSDAQCAAYLMEVAAVMSLLPPPRLPLTRLAGTAKFFQLEKSGAAPR